MQIRVSQLQNQHRLVVDALKRGEVIELTYHGKILGIIQPKSESTASQANAVNAFFGMHSDQSVDYVEDELRQVRKGRLANRDF